MKNSDFLGMVNQIIASLETDLGKTGNDEYQKKLITAQIEEIWPWKRKPKSMLLTELVR